MFLQIRAKSYFLSMVVKMKCCCSSRMIVLILYVRWNLCCGGERNLLALRIISLIMALSHGLTSEMSISNDLVFDGCYERVSKTVWCCRRAYLYLVPLLSKLRRA